MKRTDRYVLYLLYLLLFGVPIVAMFYAVDEEGHLYVSMFVILTSIGFRYRQDIRREEYAANKISGRMWSKSLVWELILIPVALWLLFGLLEGGAMAQRGVVLGLSISVGCLLFEMGERLYLRRIMKRAVR
ncbi:hypothetical protein SAMN05216312_11674 [Cohnella sp. OV330]|uniref:hypothetical protein n=1 Tax=Cohnella sp. OV330 TaxID=1855288 RepID=UPI0008F24EDC|nr:hypothetical protein [Cohnella sp. OV330]SFB60056.1 hypothetical protein SAMN05216312_11674 [Cohnella sp. OV330]